MSEEFGKMLRMTRLEKDMSLRDLAEKANISFSFIGSLEKNRFNPSRDTVITLCEALNVEPHEYLTAAGFYSENKNIEKYKPFESETKDIPIVAEIPCGYPIFTEDNVCGSFPAYTITTNLNGGDYVWLKAKGDSMIGKNIFEGSLVLLRLQPEVENGDIAAVCVDSENATLKRVFYTDGNVTLVPENPTMKPLTYPIERIRIVGKAITVISNL